MDDEEISINFRPLPLDVGLQPKFILQNFDRTPLDDLKFPRFFYDIYIIFKTL